MTDIEPAPTEDVEAREGEGEDDFVHPYDELYGEPIASQNDPLNAAWPEGASTEDVRLGNVEPPPNTAEESYVLKPGQSRQDALEAGQPQDVS